MNPNDLPVDGRGGYLYNQNISVPVYSGGPINTTLANLDNDLFNVAGGVCTVSICFGLCLMTLLHLVTLTIPTKRRRPLFIASLIGLIFELTRLAVTMWNGMRGSEVSMYSMITQVDQTDPTAFAYTNPSLRSKVAATVNQICAPLAFMTVQFCFYLQARAVLSVLRRKYHYTIISLLSGLGVFATAWRIVESIWSITLAFADSSLDPPFWMMNVVLALYTASIIAWCLVSTIQVSLFIVKRIRMGLKNQRTDAMHILLFTCMESMLIPSKSQPSP